jgi:hypothetical protein
MTYNERAIFQDRSHVIHIPMRVIKDRAKHCREHRNKNTYNQYKFQHDHLLIIRLLWLRIRGTSTRAAIVYFKSH